MCTSRSRSMLLAALSGSLALLLSGCTNAEPRSAADRAEDSPLVIAVISDPPDSTEQLVLGELYQHAFIEAGRDAVIDILPASTGRHGMIRMGDTRADVMVGCTGDLLQALHPDRFAEIHREISELPEEEQPDYRQQVYDDLVSVMPANLDVPDPSPAEGCGGAENEAVLPQNIVPLFEKRAITRGDRQAMNQLGRALNTEDLREIVEMAREEGSVSEAVQDYFDNVGSLPGDTPTGDEDGDTGI